MASATRAKRLSRAPFGEALSELMRAQGFTFRSFGEKVDLSAGYLNHLVHGNRPVPEDEVLARLAGALGVKPEHFREWRLRRVIESLDVAEADKLYAKLAA